MRIENGFDLSLPAASAWPLLTDVPRIAPCVPGATLTASEGDDVHHGEVAVQFGPVKLTFRGRAEIVERDDAARSAKVRVQARDVKGRGGATGEVHFELFDRDGGSRVRLTTDLNLSGVVAQYGRGAGMVEDLANQILGRFAANLEEMVEREGIAAPATAAGDTAPADAAPETADAGPAPAPVAGEAPPAGPPRAASTVAAGDRSGGPARNGAGQAAPASTRPARAEAIGGFRLVLGVVWRSILRTLGLSRSGR